MRLSVLLPLVAALAASSGPSAFAQHREMGAHEHGRGSLDIAMEGNRVSMEFKAPGMDIVGFEHAPSTRAQKATLSKAKQRLANPQELFALPASAECTVEEAKVTITSDDDDHGHGHGKDKRSSSAGSAKSSDKKAASREEHEHGDFQAQYAFNCKSPGNLTSIEFGYFRAFARAQKLDVNLITPKAQTSFEVTRAKPRIDLAGRI